MQNIKVIKFSIVLISIAIVVVLFFLVLISSVTTFAIPTKESGINEDQKPLRIYLYNPEKDEMEKGFITKSLEIGEGDFISFQDEKGRDVLISNFGTNGYQCTGNCFCENENNRNSASSATIPLIKGLKYLVAALTATTAMNLAKKHFDETCRNKLKDQCPSHAILSEVDDCDSFKAEDFANTDSEGNIYKNFKCKGYCLRSQYYDGENAYLMGLPASHKRLTDLQISQFENFQAEVDNFGCERIDFEENVYVKYDSKEVEVIRSAEGEIDPALGFAYLAKKQFMIKHLHPLCSTNSLKEQDLLDGELKAFIMAKVGHTKFPMCCGHVDYENPTIMCTENVFKG